MELFENILYINLDHRTDRLEHVQGELSKMGFSHAERFPAVKLPAGNVGCTISHIKCIELAKSRGWSQVFICEDDITFTNPSQLMESARKFVDSKIEWNVLVIGGNNCHPFQPVGDFCARVQNIQTTTGYIVKQHYYDILLTNFREGLEKLMREPNKKNQYALDIHWKQLQIIHQWYVLTPLTVIQYYDYSDIEEKVVDYSSMMLDLEKRAFLEKFIQEQRKKEIFTMKL